VIARGVLGSAGSRYLVLLRNKRSSELTSDLLFIIRLVNLNNVTATRVPTEKLRYYVIFLLWTRTLVIYKSEAPKSANGIRSSCDSHVYVNYKAVPTTSNPVIEVGLYFNYRNVVLVDFWFPLELVNFQHFWSSWGIYPFLWRTDIQGY